MLDNIPQNRIILYIMILGLIIPILAFMNFTNAKGTLDSLSKGIEEIQTRAFVTERKQAVNKAVIEEYLNGDRFYVDKTLEKLTLLEPEKNTLQKVTENKNYVGDEAINRRLAFLKGKENQMLFTEGVVINYPRFQETLLTLAKPVEVSVDDIRTILSLIEAPNPSAMPPPPQLLITDFTLDRKTVSEKNEVFLLNLKILKREFES